MISRDTNVLPHFSKLDHRTIQNIEGIEGLVRNQGFYVYRNNRLIIHGTWFGIFKYGELSDLVRVKVEIPNSMDHIWQISIDKKDAKLPQDLKFRLKSYLLRYMQNQSAFIRDVAQRLQ